MGGLGARAPCLPATRAKRHKAPCENASSPIYHSIPSRSLSSARRVSSSLDRSHSLLVIASSSCCRVCRVPDYTCLPCGGKHARIAPSLPQYTIQQITLGHADNTNHALSTSSHPFSTQDPPSPGLVWSTTGLWPLLVEGGITELGQHRHYRAPRHCAPADNIPRIHTTARTNTY